MLTNSLLLPVPPFMFGAPCRCPGSSVTNTSSGWTQSSSIHKACAVSLADKSPAIAGVCADYLFQNNVLTGIKVRTAMTVPFKVRSVLNIIFWWHMGEQHACWRDMNNIHAMIFKVWSTSLNCGCIRKQLFWTARIARKAGLSKQQSITSIWYIQLCMTGRKRTLLPQQVG